MDWRSSEPNGLTTENCVEAYSTSNGDGWNDVACTLEFNVICQLQCATLNPTAIPTAEPTSLV